MSLHNLGNRLSELGRCQQALAPAAEAAAIYRRLAEANPDSYLPELALSLLAYAWICVNLKDNLTGAFNAIDELISLYESSAQQLPQRFADQLFLAYRTLADVLETLGRTDESEDLRQQLD